MSDLIFALIDRRNQPACQKSLITTHGMVKTQSTILNEIVMKRKCFLILQTSARYTLNKSQRWAPKRLNHLNRCFHLNQLSSILKFIREEKQKIVSYFTFKTQSERDLLCCVWQATWQLEIVWKIIKLIVKHVRLMKNFIFQSSIAWFP